MIILDVEQGSPEWFASRLGKPTSSRFSDIVTSKGEPSKSATKYIDELLAEHLAGQPIDQMEPTKWMIRGTENEDKARKAFSFITGKDVSHVGICFTDDMAVGCSPDGFHKMKEGLEIKCPKGSTLVNYYRKGVLPTGYVQQVQGSLYVTGFDVWNFIAWHEHMEPFIISVERDDVFIGKLEEQLALFNEKLEAQKELLKEYKVEA